MDGLIEFAPLLARGALVTVSVALLALALATFLGALGAVGKMSSKVLPRGAANVYTTIVRGIPDLVLILLIYFGAQRSINVVARSMDLGYIEISKYWAGVFAIGFIYGAYLSETFRGAYLNVPKGQGEAAQALGMSRLATLHKVLMPQIIRLALPGYSNVWQVLIKSTAVVSVIGLEDLVGLADKAGKAERASFLFMAVVIVAFLIFTSASKWIFDRVETRVNRGQTT